MNADKTNIESHVWIFSGIFKNCKDRAVKNANWSQEASAKATEEEIKQFSNCIAKNIKAMALYPTIFE